MTECEKCGYACCDYGGLKVCFGCGYMKCICGADGFGLRPKPGNQPQCPVCGQNSAAEREQREKAYKGYGIAKQEREDLRRCEAERDKLKAELAACGASLKKEVEDRLDTEAELAEAKKILEEPEDAPLVSAAHLAELRQLRSDLAAAKRIVEACKAHREFVRVQFEKLALTGECDVVFNLGHVLDAILRAEFPTGEKGEVDE